MTSNSFWNQANKDVTSCGCRGETCIFHSCRMYVTLVGLVLRDIYIFGRISRIRSRMSPKRPKKTDGGLVTFSLYTAIHSHTYPYGDVSSGWGVFLDVSMRCPWYLVIPIHLISFLASTRASPLQGTRQPFSMQLASEKTPPGPPVWSINGKGG